MENLDYDLSCPGCGCFISAIILHDLNRCDNCGLPAHYFDIGICEGLRIVT